MSVILDASALLALIFNEQGADIVAPQARASRILSVNFSEVIHRVLAIDGNPDRAEEAADLLKIEVAPFDRQLARLTAELREETAFMGASFADRACLAFALASSAPVLSSDQDWRKLEIGVDIRMIR